MEINLACNQKNSSKKNNNNVVNYSIESNKCVFSDEVENEDEEEFNNVECDEYDEYDEYDNSVSTNCMRGQSKFEKIDVYSKNSSRNYAEEEFIYFVNNEPSEETIIDTLIYSHLIDLFDSIDIKLKLVNRPSLFNTKKASISANTKCFLMDLRRNKDEDIIIFPGVDTKLEIISIDQDSRKVLIKINEPVRDEVVTMKVRDRKKTNKYVVVTTAQHTYAEQRIFLIGKDEGHLFISPIKDVFRTVKEAYESLKPEELKDKTNNYYRRQGEWIFIPINYNIPMSQFCSTILPLSLRIGSGRSHIVTESFTCFGITYVRGNVTNPNYKTLILKKWHRYICNLKLKNNINGLTWVD